MLAIEHEIKFPETFITQRDLEEHGMSPEISSIYKRYALFMQRVQQRPIVLNNVEFYYKARMPVMGLKFSHLDPLLETPYMLGAGVATDRIGGDFRNVDEERYKQEIITGMSNLLNLTELASVNQIRWTGPIKTVKHRRPTISIQSWRDLGFYWVTYRPTLDELDISWQEYHPATIYKQDFVPYSLVAHSTLTLFRSDNHRTGILSNRFTVLEVPWGLDMDNRPELRRGINILEKYLMPDYPVITLARGDFEACRFLTRRFMDVLNLGTLYQRN